jgi:retinal pigment epithelial membrane protein
MHLDHLGISALQVTPDPVCIATEGALWGSIQAQGLLRDMVIVSDDAGQFDVGRHALCWVHAERLVHKLDTFTDLHRAAQERMRALIWWFYDDLKAYRAEPTARRRGEQRARFDRIFHRRTGFVTLDRLLERDGAPRKREGKVKRSAALWRAPAEGEPPLHNVSLPRMGRGVQRVCRDGAVEVLPREEHVLFGRAPMEFPALEIKVVGVQIRRWVALQPPQALTSDPRLHRGGDVVGQAFLHGEQILEEGHLPIELDPATLATRGVQDFGGGLRGPFTAHPKADPITGELAFSAFPSMAN